MQLFVILIYSIYIWGQIILILKIQNYETSIQHYRFDRSVFVRLFSNPNGSNIIYRSSDTCSQRCTKRLEKWNTHQRVYDCQWCFDNRVWAGHRSPHHIHHHTEVFAFGLHQHHPRNGASADYDLWYLALRAWRLRTRHSSRWRWSTRRIYSIIKIEYRTAAWYKTNFRLLFFLLPATVFYYTQYITHILPVFIPVVSFIGATITLPPALGFHPDRPFYLPIPAIHLLSFSKLLKYTRLVLTPLSFDFERKDNGFIRSSYIHETYSFSILPTPIGWNKYLYKKIISTANIHKKGSIFRNTNHKSSIHFSYFIIYLWIWADYKSIKTDYRPVNFR